jgi:hypothetical protein
MDIVVVTSLCVHINYEYMSIYVKVNRSYTFHSFLALNSTYIICEVPNLISTLIYLDPNNNMALRSLRWRIQLWTNEILLRTPVYFPFIARYVTANYVLI